MYSLQDLAKRHERNLGRVELLDENIERLSNKISKKKALLGHCLEAQTVIQQVAKKTQEELEFHVSEMVTLALNSIFNDNYSFELSFAIRRGKTEADMFLIKDGEQLDPLTSSGGGVSDVISFALRISLWSLNISKTKKVMILDEPFKNLSKELHPKASKLLKELNSKLGIQFIIVTHCPELIEHADKVFTVKQVKGVSRVVENT